MKKFLSILFPISAILFMWENRMSIGRFIMISGIPLFILTFVVDVLILLWSIVFWTLPHLWYFPFTGDIYTMMLDRMLIVVGLVLAIADSNKR